MFSIGFSVMVRAIARWIERTVDRICPCGEH